MNRFFCLSGKGHIVDLGFFAGPSYETQWDKAWTAAAQNNGQPFYVCGEARAREWLAELKNLLEDGTCQRKYIS